jgi:hypothetical protein
MFGLTERRARGSLGTTRRRKHAGGARRMGSRLCLGAMSNSYSRSINGILVHVEICSPAKFTPVQFHRASLYLVRQL